MRMMNTEQKLEKPILTEDVTFRKTDEGPKQEEWNWVDSRQVQDEDVLARPANYYEATLSPWKTFPALEHDCECDMVVVGGGLLGASTALHLSESGVETILLEKNKVGSAASGRNGGQLTPGLARWEAESIIENFDYDEACRLWKFTSIESFDLIQEITERYALDLDMRRGHLTAAIHPGHINALTVGADARRYLGDDSVRILGPYEIRDHINSELYYGGALDKIGGQIHSLGLTRGLIYGFVKNGGHVYEDSEVLKIETVSEGVSIETAQGKILAKKGVVLAVHHTTFQLLSDVNSTIPFYTYVGVTNPIEGGSKTLLPTQMAVYDTQLQIDYYRPVRKERILFGGQGTGMRWNSDKVVDYLMSRIKTIFPQRDDIHLELAWSGTTDLTLNGAVDCRKLGEKAPIYAVHGWSGHGIAQTVRIGKAIRDDFLKLNDDFEMLASIEHRSILMGRQLAPVAIPLAKSLLGLGNKITPGKMISF